MELNNRKYSVYIDNQNGLGYAQICCRATDLCHLAVGYGLQYNDRSVGTKHSRCGSFSGIAAGQRTEIYRFRTRPARCRIRLRQRSLRPR